jgi:tetratricopeptide (TPR) repeat protein
LANLGSVYSKQGKWTQAKESYQEALESAHQLNDAERLSTLLEGLGVVEINCREDQSAIEHLQESLTIARQIGYCERIISVLTNLSIVTRICGEDEQAKEYLQEGLKLARKTKNRLYTSAILSQLGTLELKMQAIDAASLALRESLEIALEANIPEQIAIARCALAQVAALQGNPFEALAQGRESLTIFDAIGSHKATEVKQWLTAYENALLHQFPKLNQQ